MLLVVKDIIIQHVIKNQSIIIWFCLIRFGFVRKKLSVLMVFRCNLYRPYKMEDLIGLARIWLGFGRLREIDYIIWKSGLSVSILWFLIEPDSSVFMFIHDLFADHISLSNSLPPFYSKTDWFLWNRVNPAKWSRSVVLDPNRAGRATVGGSISYTCTGKW